MTFFPREKKSFPKWAKIVLPLIVLFFFVSGAWFFLAQQKYQRQSVEENLLSIADLKSRQISGWRTERMWGQGGRILNIKY